MAPRRAGYAWLGRCCKIMARQSILGPGLAGRSECKQGDFECVHRAGFGSPLAWHRFMKVAGRHSLSSQFLFRPSLNPTTLRTWLVSLTLFVGTLFYPPSARHPRKGSSAPRNSHPLSCSAPLEMHKLSRSPGAMNTDSSFMEVSWPGLGGRRGTGRADNHCEESQGLLPQTARRMFGVELTSARPCNLRRPNFHRRPSRSHPVPRLAPKSVAAWPPGELSGAGRRGELLRALKALMPRPALA